MQRLRWLGHVMRMSDDRTAKIVLKGGGGVYPRENGKVVLKEGNKMLWLKTFIF